jgi:ABC-type nitrate/sulfonate/bicarbonate transport system permease component
MTTSTQALPVRWNSRKVSRGAVSVLGVAVALGSWQLAGDGNVSPYLPPMSTAMVHAWQLVTGPDLTADILPSIARALIGLAIGSVLGAVAGLVVGRGGLHDWVRPALEFQRALPIVAVAPVALLAFAPDSTTRTGIVALAAFWPVFVNAESASSRVDPRWTETARSLGHGRATVLFRVVLPGSLPMIFAGVQVATSLALLATVVSEFFLATSGIGYQIEATARNYDVADMFGWIIIIGVIGRLLSIATALLGRRTLRWYAGQKGLSS